MLKKTMMLGSVLFVPFNFAYATINVQQSPDCIRLGAHPSMIIKFRNKTSSLTQKHALKASELSN